MEELRLVEVEDVYVRLLPKELASVVAENQEFFPEFKLKIGNVILKLSKVRLAGRVESVEDRGRIVDVVLSDGEGRARVRAWDDAARGLLALKTGILVEVFGVLRTFRGELYVAYRFLRRIDEERLQEYVKMLERDRSTFAAMGRRGTTASNLPDQK